MVSSCQLQYIYKMHFYFSYPLKYVFFKLVTPLMWNINKHSVNTDFTQIWLIRINKNITNAKFNKWQKEKSKNTMKIMLIQNKVCIPNADAE